LESVIVVFVADLMFQTRVESTAENLGYRVKLVENTAQVVSMDLEGLPFLGIEGILIDQLSRLGPCLLIFDLGNADIPWVEWIPALKMVPATRRIPILCFGSHVDVDTLQRARQTGADEVLARSRFVTALPELIQKHAQQNDVELLSDTCAQTLHPLALRGLELFNQGDYFAAHEELEEAWKEDLSLGRDLYRGILQVAVAYYQIRRGNFKGAMKMFQRSRQWLDPLPGACRGINVAQLRLDAYAVHDQVLALGPENIDDFVTENLQPVHFTAIT